MSEKQITNRMGLPDRVVTPAQRLRSRTWMCSNYGDLTKVDEPIPVTHPVRGCRPGVLLRSRQIREGTRGPISAPQDARGLWQRRTPSIKRSRLVDIGPRDR